MFFNDYAKFDRKKSANTSRDSKRRPGGSKQDRGGASIGSRNKKATPKVKDSRKIASARTVNTSSQLRFRLRYWLIILVGGYLLLVYHGPLIDGCNNVCNLVSRGWHSVKEFFVGSESVQHPITIKFYPVRMRGEDEIKS